MVCPSVRMCYICCHAILRSIDKQIRFCLQAELCAMSALSTLWPSSQTARQTQDAKVKEFCFADVYYLIVQDEQYKRDSRVVQHMLLCRYIMYL